VVERIGTSPSSLESAKAVRTDPPVSGANSNWLFGKGLKKTLLYGLDRSDPAKPLIPCELLWAPLWFHEHGLQAASLMGAEMTEEQERRLDRYPAITAALDSECGRHGKSCRHLGRLKEKLRIESLTGSREPFSATSGGG